MKELRRGLIVPGAPGLSGVDADERALIADQQNDVGKVRIDPKILIIVTAGRAAKTHPRFAAVSRAHGHGAGAVNDIGILWINARNWQIASANAPGRPRISGDSSPVFPGIVGAVDPDTWFVRGPRPLE